jgi:hypothetical protein
LGRFCGICDDLAGDKPRPECDRKADKLTPLLRVMPEPLGGLEQRSSPMCDYSLHHVKSRAANVGDKLITRNFGAGTRGFAAPNDTTTAVCVLPGTELAFAEPVTFLVAGHSEVAARRSNFNIAIFRQVNKTIACAHHDALEFPDGRMVMLTALCEGQMATVLQLPAQPATEAEAAAQRRVEYIG